MNRLSLSIRSAFAKGRAHFEISGQPGGIQFHDFPKTGLWRFTIRAGLGQYCAEKLFVTLPVTAWRPKEYRIGPVNVDFVDTGRMAVPQMECWVNGEHYHNVWFQVPSRADLQENQIEAICAVPIEDPNAVVEFRSLDPIEIRTIEAGEDERQKLLEQMRATGCQGDTTERHPRLFVDAATLGLWRERMQTTHAKEWQRIQTLLDGHLHVPGWSKKVVGTRNEDGREYLDAGNRLVLYSLGYLMTQRRDYFDAAWAVAQELLRLEHWGWPVSTGKGASFMTHYGCDNDMCQGHTEDVAMSLFYDWCHEALTEEQRRQVAAKLAHHAEIVYRHSIFQLSEWASQYISDHHTGSMAGLNIAAFALLGKDARAPQWLMWCRAVLEKALRYLPQHDPAGWEWLMTVMPMLWQAELWRGWSGEDLFPKLHLQESFEWHLYMSLSSAVEWTLAGRLGKDRWAPLLIANRLRLPSAQWVAAQLEDLSVKGWSKVQAARRVWEFLFYDPSVSAAPPDLPVSRLLKELEAFRTRSHWKIPSEDGWVFSAWCCMPMPQPALKESNTRANYHLIKPSNGHYCLAIGNTTFLGPPDHGYYPLTSQANCITIDGQGQIGEHDWLGPRVADSELAYIEAHEEESAHGPLADCLKADRLERLRMNLQPCYPQSLGVERYCREILIFRRPDGIAGIGIRDEIRTREARHFCSRAHTSGFLEMIADGQWRLCKGNGELWLTLLAKDRMKTGIHPTELVRSYVAPPEEEMEVRHVAWENEAPSCDFGCVLLFTNHPVSRLSLNGLPTGSRGI